jgi:hypothetical protein
MVLAKKNMRVIGITAAALAALLSAGCAGRTSTIGSGGQAQAAEKPSVPASDSAAAPVTSPAAAPAVLSGRELADQLWSRRANPDTARLALAAYGEAAKSNPDAALLARLSRAHYLVANYVETDPARKDSLFLKGVEAAEKAMSTDPAFVKNFQETKDEKKAVQVLGMSHIEAIYWYSANLGKWASTKSLMVRLGNKSKLEAYSKRVLDLDEKFFHGAPHRFFGALPTKVPGGDLKVSKAHFEKAIAIEPNYFGTRTLFAELYATKARDKDVFVKQLDYVLAGDPASLPDSEPENRYEQAAAKQLKEKLNEWFD